MKEEHLYIMEKAIGYIKCKTLVEQTQRSLASNKI
jgi:hypothetical protein